MIIDGAWKGPVAFDEAIVSETIYRVRYPSSASSLRNRGQERGGGEGGEEVGVSI